MIIIMCFSLVFGILAAYIKISTKHLSNTSIKYMSRKSIKAMEIIGVIFVCLFILSACGALFSGFKYFLAMLAVIPLFIICTIVFYFLFKVIFKKLLDVKKSKVIKKLKQTPLWEDMVCALNNYLNCPVYIFKDGIAIKRNPNLKYVDYSVYDKIIEESSNNYANQNNEFNNNEFNYDSLNECYNTCEVIKFSNYNLTDLDDYRMRILGEAIIKLYKPIKYTSYTVTSSLTKKELIYDNNGSNGHISIYGSICTYYPPTAGTSHYETKTIYSAVKYVVVYPQPPKIKNKKIKYKKSRKNNWL